MQRALRAGAVLLAVGLIPSPYDKLVHAGVFAMLAGAMGYASGLRERPMLVVAWLGAVAVGALALLARDRIKVWLLA